MGNKTSLSRFTSWSLLKDSLSFVRQNYRAILLIVSVPMLFDAGFQYLNISFGLSSNQFFQVTEALQIPIPSLSALVFYLVHMYLVGAAYCGIQKLFFTQEQPIFPDFLISLEVRRSGIYFLVNTAVMAILTILSIVPVCLAIWFNDVYPVFYWPMALVLITGALSLYLVGHTLVFSTRLLLSMPAQSVYKTTRLIDILRLANQIGVGHAKSFIGVLVLLTVFVGISLGLLSNLLSDFSIVTMGLESAFRWFDFVIMIIIYAIAFQAICQYQVATDGIAKQ